MSATYQVFKMKKPMVDSHPIESHLWFSADAVGRPHTDGTTKYVKQFFAVNIESQLQHVLNDLTKDHHWYEIIPDGVPVQPYFDLEMEGVAAFENDADHQQKRIKLEGFLAVLTAYMKAHHAVQLCPEDFAILDSCREAKLSFHVLIRSKVYFESRSDHKVFIAALHKWFSASSDPAVIDLAWPFNGKKQETRFIFDNKPYGTDVNFRLPNQSKMGKPYVLKTPTPIDQCFIRLLPGREEGRTPLDVSQYRPVTVAKKRGPISPVQNELLIRDDVSELTTADDHSSCTSLDAKFTAIQKAYYCLGARFFDKGSHDMHVALGYATASELGERGRKLFCDKTRELGTAAKIQSCDYQYTQCMKGRDGPGIRTIKSIMYWARADQPALFKTFFPSESEEDGVDEMAAVICNNDNEAADHFLAQLKDRLISVGGQLFYKATNIWTNNAEHIQAKLLTTIMESNVKRLSPAKGDGESKTVDFAQNTGAAKSILEALMAKVKARNNTPNLYRKFHDTTRGRLCFSDGVLDIPSRRFYTWDEIDFEFYSCVQIDRPFGTYYKTPDLTLVNELRRKVIDPLFGEKADTALHFLSRAIAGHMEDKNWASFLGKRDCGKGVLFEALGAFGDYIGAFDLGNILYQRNTNKPLVARDLYWLIDLQFMRLAIAQEVPHKDEGKKASGALIKKMTSGGDTIVARRNYDRIDTHFTLDTTFMIMGNDVLEVEPKDTLEHCIEFTSVGQFKTQQDIDLMREAGEPEEVLCVYRVKDETLKRKLHSIEYMHAFVYLLVSNYKDTAVSISANLTDDEDEHKNTIRSKLFKFYKFTGSQDDAVVCQTIYSSELFKDGNPKHVLAEVLSIPGVAKRKSTRRDDTRNKWMFFGMREKTLEELQI